MQQNNAPSNQENTTSSNNANIGMLSVFLLMMLLAVCCGCTKAPVSNPKNIPAKDSPVPAKLMASNMVTFAEFLNTLDPHELAEEAHTLHGKEPFFVDDNPYIQLHIEQYMVEFKLPEEHEESIRGGIIKLKEAIQENIRQNHPEARSFIFRYAYKGYKYVIGPDGLHVYTLSYHVKTYVFDVEVNPLPATATV